MKKRTLFWLLTAAAALVVAFLPETGGSVFGLFALPLKALGWMLRTLSLSGAVGNAVALVLYALICALPLVFWWRSRRRTEDWLLVLLSGVLAAVLYYMINPDLRGSLMRNGVGDAVCASVVWSTLTTWAVLKLLYSGYWESEGNLYRALRIFLMLCAASCLIEGIGSGLPWVLGGLEMENYSAVDANRGITLAFIAVRYLVLMLEKGLCALVLCKGAGLMGELERDPFGPGCVTAANAVSVTCRNALAIICLSVLALNIAQLLLSPMLMSISVTVNFPVSGLAVCFALLSVTKLLVRGKELKDDNDLFV